MVVVSAAVADLLRKTNDDFKAIVETVAYYAILCAGHNGDNITVEKEKLIKSHHIIFIIIVCTLLPPPARPKWKLETRAADLVSMYIMSFLCNKPHSKIRCTVSYYL
jgi:hypothetical protein